MSLRFKKRRVDSSITPDLLKDRKVQLLLGWFVHGDIETLQPALDQENGIRYPALDTIVNDPSCTEPFLESLADANILDKHACGYVLSCKGCGAVLSLRVEREDASNVDRPNPTCARAFSQPPLAIIPCFCDILLAQRASLFIRDKPEHPFTWTLNEIALRIEKIR